MCFQKFDLHVQFITRLNTFAHEWAHASAIACLSRKDLYFDKIQPVVYTPKK